MGQQITYVMFDMLTLEEFQNKRGNRKYTERLDTLKDLYQKQGKIDNLYVVNYERYSPEALERWNQKVKEYNWEGLMFRKDVGYEGKRSQNLLKYKMFVDEEFKVIGVEEGDAQELINGVMHKIKCVGSLIIEYKGNKVNVGTGLSLEQRKAWYEHPEEIIGSTITVKYFEATKNQDNTWSLRFPVLKAVYKGDRDI